MQTEKQENRRLYKVYTIVEKPDSEKDFWLDIGIASENRDGSFRVKLDALPTNGTLHIRKYEPKKTDFFNQNEKQPTNKWR